MKSRRIKDFPQVHVHLDPDVLARITRTAERRSLSVSAVIREALDWAYHPEGVVLGGSTLENAKLGRG
jgi:Ribbon-helix-helix protein, copG family